MFTQLEDLDFADDLALVSENHTHMQQKTDRLQTNSDQLALKINTGKTKTMRMWSILPTWGVTSARMEEQTGTLRHTSAKHR